MKALRLMLIALILMISTMKLAASGTVAIYAIIEKVVFEPNESAPERIQIWGAFTLADGGAGTAGLTLTPRRGYMYFSLPSSTSAWAERVMAIREWRDFKSVAGTGQGVAFGQVGYIGAFTDELISRPAGIPPYLVIPTAPGEPLSSKNILRPESATPPSAPDPYITNIGVTRLSATGNLAAVVEKLKAALKR